MEIDLDQDEHKQIDLTSQKYQLKDVLRIIGNLPKDGELPRERFNEWMAKGFINASVETRKGSRIFKEYTLLDIYSIAVFRHMIEECSISRELAGNVINKWKSSLKNNPDGIKSGVLFLIFRSIDEIDIIPGTTDQTQIKRSIYTVSFPKADDYAYAVSKAVELVHANDEAGEWSYIMVVNVKNVISGVDSRL